MISERFGKWTVINDDTKDNKGRTLYTVKCDCGTIKTTKKDTLTSGKSTQCLKCFCNRGNIYKIGDKIHNWTILEEGKNKWMERHYLCKCECGKEKIVRKRDLERNKSTRCVSCWISQKNTTHNNSTSATYRIWTAMRQRCENPRSKSYKWYGYRGIKICERWQNFAWFLEDMGPRPDGLTIDRIDPDGNYELSNCRWSTLEEQHGNRRNSAKHSNEYVYVKKSSLCQNCLPTFFRDSL
jgi:hypothetical protein